MLRWIKGTRRIVGWVQPWDRQLQEGAEQARTLLRSVGEKKKRGRRSISCRDVMCLPSQSTVWNWWTFYFCPSNFLIWLYSLYCTGNLIYIYNIKKRNKDTWRQVEQLSRVCGAVTKCPGRPNGFVFVFFLNLNCDCVTCMDDHCLLYRHFMDTRVEQSVGCWFAFADHAFSCAWQMQIFALPSGVLRQPDRSSETAGLSLG